MPTATSFRCIGIQGTLVVVRLLRVPNRLVVPEDRELKVEVLLLHLPNRSVSSHSSVHRSDKCHCLTRINLDSSHSFRSLDNCQDSVPDHQAVPHPLRSAMEVTVHRQDRNLDLHHSRLVLEDMVVRDRRLVHNRSLPEQVTVDRVDQHLLLDRNRSAADTIMEHME